MAAVSYDLDIEVWEFLDIWATGGNAEATKLFAALRCRSERFSRLLLHAAAENLTEAQ